MTRAGSCLVVALALLASVPATAQDAAAPDGFELPTWGSGGFDGVYPLRLLTIEGGRVVGERGVIGLGDTRWAIHERVELLTNTLSDIIGIANGGVKVALLEPDGTTGPAIAATVRGYWSYGGLIDTAVRKVAESFATVTDSDVRVSGVVGHLTATWTASEDRTHLHASLQAHHAIENKFRVEDSRAGGGGSVEFRDGNDLSAMWGVDHRLVGRAVVGVLEAGYSLGLERPRFGAGVDVGSENLRVLLGVSYPGVETDLATEPRDFVVNPAFSVHYRFR